MESLPRFKVVVVDESDVVRPQAEIQELMLLVKVGPGSRGRDNRERHVGALGQLQKNNVRKSNAQSRV